MLPRIDIKVTPYINIKIAGVHDNHALLNNSLRKHEVILQMTKVHGISTAPVSENPINFLAHYRLTRDN